MSSSQDIIGRKDEMEVLDRLFKSKKSEFAIVYGRRRVGKTYLVTRKFEGQFTFHLIALGKASLKEQLLNFHTSLVSYGPSFANKPIPETWFEAFQYLQKLAARSGKKRKVIFLDELPWLDTYNSGFISALEHFWNSWAALRSDILLISCGSAASWMINKLIRDRGGLHNRVTERILLQPFTLRETEVFLQSNGAVYDRYQLLQLYMVMGGIPFYLENIRVNRSVAQNIDRMFFTPSGLLNQEYGDLFRSLFKNYKKHLAVVEALSSKKKGLTRKELLAKTSLKDGGSITNVLDELEQSSFIKRYLPFGKTKRGSLYQLTDPYTLFYLSFVKNSKAEGTGAWLSRLDSPRWRAWSGYAFEQLCRYHVSSLKKHLGISGIYTETSTWRSDPGKNRNGAGAQIDLIIDRNDRVINLCEIKFSTSPFSITKPYAANLENKVSAFREETKTRKTILLTMVTTFGLKPNKYSMRLVQDSINMEALFD